MPDKVCRGDEVSVSLFATASLSAADGPGSRVTVFFQGCDSGCAWCHSPHSRPKASPLLFRADACTLCGRCATACPNGVHMLSGETHRLCRDVCRRCGRCIEACPHSAAARDSGVLHLPTREVSVCSLLRQLSPALSIADGITLSGGEALYQTDAAVALLRLCKQRGIHTAVETSGLLAPERYAAAAPYTDVWLFGLRVCTAPRAAYRTDAVLAALACLRQASDAAIMPRIPAIPGVMDRPETCKELLRVLERMDADEVWLNPWNRFYMHYYALSGIEPVFPAPSEEAVRRCESGMKAFFRRNGYTVNMIAI